MSEGVKAFSLKSVDWCLRRLDVARAFERQLAVDLQAGVSANRGGGRVGCVEFLDRKVCIDFSNAFEVDFPTCWIDVVDGHCLFGRFNEYDLLHSVAQDCGTH